MADTATNIRDAGRTRYRALLLLRAHRRVELRGHPCTEDRVPADVRLHAAGFAPRPVMVCAQSRARCMDPSRSRALPAACEDDSGKGDQHHADGHHDGRHIAEDEVAQDHRHQEGRVLEGNDEARLSLR